MPFSILKILLILSFIFITWNHGFSKPVLLKQFQTVIPEYENLSILEDHTNSLNFSDVKQMHQEFSKNHQKTINLGLSNSTYWVKFKVKNLITHGVNTEWSIFVRNVFLDQMFIFIERENKEVIGTGNLQNLAYTNEHVRYRFPTAKFRIKYFEEMTFYIKLQTQSAANYPIVIMPYDQLMFWSNLENILFGVNIGILIVSILASSSLFFSIRDNIFLCLIAHIISIIFVEETLMGVIQFFSAVNSLQMPPNIFLISVGISHAIIIMFTIEFFRLKVSDLMYKIFILILIINILISIISFFSIILSLRIMMFAVMSMFLGMLFISIIKMREGDKQGLYYLISWFPLFLAMSSKFMTILGFPMIGIYSELAIFTGVILHFLSIKYIILMRVKLINDERIDMRSKLIDHIRKRAELSKVFEIFVPTLVLKKFIDYKTAHINLEKTEHSFITLFFSDMRGFTNLAEKMIASSLFRFLNLYFEKFNKEVVKNGGVIDKYIGDSAMVIYHQPDLSSTSEVDSAIKTAVTIQKKLYKYNQIFKRNIPKTGIGIHSGPVIMGAIGAKTRKDFTVIGDAVNLTSRLESLTKFYHVNILLSEASYDLATSKENIRFVDHIAVYGKTEPIKIYQKLVNQEIQEFAKIKQNYSMAIDLYYQKNFQKALTLFENMYRLSEDHVVSIFMMRCQKFLTKPPELNWSGVFYLDSK